jgi:hypothetical protein
MTKTLIRQRAESLLEVHNGACSVWMEKEGLVTIKPSGGIVGMVDVRMERQTA